MAVGTAELTIAINARDRASRTLRRLKGLAGAFGLALGVAGLVGAARKTISAFADFDDAMTKSLAIMGDVSATMRTDMEGAAREVAKTTEFSATQAAESYFFLASAGMSAAESLGAMPKVAKFATAGNFDLATATDLLTDAQSALGLNIGTTTEKMENMARVGDVLVKANTLANATVEQFSTALTTEAGAALKTMGKDMEEGVAVLAAFADQGVKGQVAGSGLSRIIRLMTAAATKNKKKMSELGIEVFDSSGKMNNMADIVEDLEDSLGKMSDEERTASLEAIGFSARVQGVILPLLGSSEAIRNYEKELRNAGGTMDIVAKKNLVSLTAKWKMLKSRVVDVMISIGAKMSESINKFMPQLTRAWEDFKETAGFTGNSMETVGEIIDNVVAFLITMFEWFTKLIGVIREHWEVIKVATIAWIAFKTALAIGGAVQGAMTSLKMLAGAQGLGAVTTSAGRATGGLRGLKGMAGTLPAAVTITAIALVAGAIAEFRKLQDELDTLKEKSETLKKSAGDLETKLKGVTDPTRRREIQAIIDDTHRASVKAAQVAEQYRGLRGLARSLIDIGPKFLRTRGMQHGGIVPGTGNTDKVPTLLTPGELVVPKDLVNKFGNTVNINVNATVRSDNDINMLTRRLGRLVSDASIAR